MELPFLPDHGKYDVFRCFESQCRTIFHGQCLCCHSVRIGLKLNSIGACTKCAKHKHLDYFMIKTALPTWMKKGKHQFQLPAELSGLSHAEKMLIQRISPFVPLHHIKRGIFGLRGHVCAFDQDVNEFLQRLPRTRDDTTLLKVVQSIRAEVGSTNSTSTKCFRVRRTKIKGALEWLKANNPLYGDIIIEMDRLDWIEGGRG